MKKNDKKKSLLSICLTVQPLVYVFLVVFITRTDIRWFFGLGLLMLANLGYFLPKIEKNSYKRLAYVLVALSSIGLAAASILLIEKIETLQNPQMIASCSISPIVSCTPTAASDQASIFRGVPNPLIGVFGFSAVLTAGMTMLAGAEKLKKEWWLALLAGVTFNALFCLWLIQEGLYSIGSLCLYCMSVWMVTFTTFWLVLAEALKNKHTSVNKQVDDFIIKNRDNFIAASIAIVILLIYFRWSDYWNSLL